MIYVSAFFTSTGNYKGHYDGDSKILPGISAEKMEVIVKSSKAFEKTPEAFEALWIKVKDLIYSFNDRNQSQGMKGEGVTTYFSSNCTREDAAIVSDWMKAKKLEAYNCRTFKTVNDTGKASYEIRLASIETGDAAGITMQQEDYKGSSFRVTRGDYRQLFPYVIKFLREASKFTANDGQKRMLEAYIESFTTGDLNMHKEGSRFWVLDKEPAVEGYIGFMFTYRDPAGERGEFFGWTAMMNRKLSEKLQVMVQQAENFLADLPWGKNFEKDKFSKPDFISIDAMAYAGSGVPRGMSIPITYEEIRHHEGFKNVTLGNVLSCRFKSARYPFLSPEDQELMEKYREPAFIIQLALHELLGHGSGKLFRCDESGELNFDASSVVDPLTGAPIKKWYEPGETFDSVFKAMGSSYEECRAISVGYYLCFNRDVMAIFGHTDEQEIENLIYIGWLFMVYVGAGRALTTWNPTTRQWGQAHSQARYAIMRVLHEAGVVTIDETEPGKMLRIKLDKAKVFTDGREAMRKFLCQLQVYKSTADYEKANELYEKYSKVDGQFEKWRDIVVLHQDPMLFFVQANTEEVDGKVSLKTYTADSDGLMESWRDRFGNDAGELQKIMEEIYESDKHHFET
jgi:dipeptidyl-peptidase III